MQELIEFVLEKALPEGVEYKVTPQEDEQGIVFIVDIPEEYRGKIIGKGGRNIKALRDVVSIIARREDQRVFIKIAD